MSRPYFAPRILPVSALQRYTSDFNAHALMRWESLFLTVKLPGTGYLRLRTIRCRRRIGFRRVDVYTIFVGVRRIAFFALFFGIGRVGVFVPFNAGGVGAITPFDIGWVAALTFFTAN
ncbi:hypothetical protein V8E52_007483 [Russula decolorans]